MGKTSFLDAGNLTIGCILGLSFCLLGFALGGGHSLIFSVPGYTLLAGAVILTSFRGGEGVGPAWFFYPAVIICLAIFSLAQWNGGGSWVGWQDLLVLGVVMSYFIAVRGGGSGEFLSGSLLVMSIFGLVSAGVVFSQAAGYFTGHPLWWMSPRHLPNSLGDSNYISGLLPTRTTSAAAFNALALMVLGLALWGKQRAGWRIVSFWAAGVMICASLLCQSRAGIIGLGFGTVGLLIASLVVTDRYKIKSTLGYWSGIGGVMLCILSLFYVLFFNHWGVRGRILSLLEDPYRIKLWSETWFQASVNQLFYGLGPGGFHQWSKKFSGRATGGDPVFLHNDWAQFALEYGWPIGALVAGIFLAHVVGGVVMAGTRAGEIEATWNWPRSDYLGGKVGGVAALLSLGAHAFFDYPMHTPAVSVLAGFAGGVCASRVTGHRSSRALSVGWVAGSILLLSGLVVALWPNLRGEISVWQAENRVASGDLKGAIKVLKAPVGGGIRGNKYRLLEQGNVAIQLAMEEKDIARRGAYIRLARESYLSVLSSEPDNTDALIGSGISSLAMGKFVDAEIRLRAAIDTNPNSPRPYEILGFCFESQGRRLESMKAYRIATRLGQSLIANRNLAKLEEESRKSP